jgi:hypothetical protein
VDPLPLYSLHARRVCVWWCSYARACVRCVRVYVPLPPPIFG